MKLWWKLTECCDDIKWYFKRKEWKRQFKRIKERIGKKIESKLCTLAHRILAHYEVDNIFDGLFRHKGKVWIAYMVEECESMSGADTLIVHMEKVAIK